MLTVVSGRMRCAQVAAAPASLSTHAAAAAQPIINEPTHYIISSCMPHSCASMSVKATSTVIQSRH